MAEEAVMERVSDGSESAPDPVSNYNSVFDKADAALESAFNSKPAEAAIPGQLVTEPVPTAQPEASAQPESTPEPAAVSEQVDTPAPPPPESVLSPFFNLWQVDDERERMGQAVQQAQAFASSDWPTFETMLNAMYWTAKGTVRDWVLADNGIDGEQIKQFSDWIAAGAPSLTPADAFPAFPTPDADPNSETYGLVRLPNGTQLDVNDPIQKELYETKKWQYEQGIEAKKAEAKQAEELKQSEAREAQALQTAQYHALGEVDTVYTAGREKVVTDLLTPLLSSLQTEEDKFHGQLLESHIYRSLLNPADPVGKQIAQIGETANRWLQETVPGMIARMRQSGANDEAIKTALHQLATTGRMLQWATEQDRITRNYVNAMKDKFNRQILNRPRAVNPTAPQVETKPVDVITPPPPDEQPPKSKEEWLERHTSRAAAALDNLIR